MIATNTHDVIVIGAGPAGCAAAAVLAEKGRRVLILEKETFPRYRIGESLLPFCYFPLERLGLLERMKESAFIKKYSVQFVNTEGKLSIPFYFEEHMQHDAAQTWQVERRVFDQIMVDNATEKGAEIRTGTQVMNFLRDESGAVTGVRVKGPDGEQEIHAPMCIDCTGREALAILKNDWRVPEPELRKIAIWTYFKGSKREDGKDEGATTLAYIPEKGWFWHIPLSNDIVSVGLVAEKDYLYRNSRDPEEIFMREVQNNSWIAEHLEGAERVEEMRTTGEYSYFSRFCAEDGLVLAGDAFGFLDPVFSSGVFFALVSGEMAGEAVDECLAAGDFSGSRFEEYSERFKTMIEGMRKIVYAYYDDSFSFGMMLKEHPHLKAPLTDCLIGNLDTDLDELFETMSRFTPAPEPVVYGKAGTGSDA